MPDNANPSTAEAIPAMNGWTPKTMIQAVTWVVSAVLIFASVFTYFAWSQNGQDDRIQGNTLGTVEIRGKIDRLGSEVSEIKRVQMRNEEKLDRILYEIRNGHP